MKYLLSLSLLLCSLVACVNTHPDSFVLSGTVENAADSEAIYLSYPVMKNGIWHKKRDTSLISNGEFRFGGCVGETTPALLNFDDMSEIELYLEPGDIKIQFDRNRPYAYTLSGTSAEKEHRELRERCMEYDALMHTQNLQLQGLVERLNSGETANMDSLRGIFYEQLALYKANNPKIDSIRLHFVREHPDYAIVPYMLFTLSRRQAYDDKFLKGIYDSLPEAAKHTLLGQLAGIQIGFHARDQGCNVGDLAFDFIRTDAAGNTVRLSGYKGRYVLLDFWASWCAPCLREAPNVKKINSEFGNQGLQVIGISCDEDRSSWLGAIEKHGLTAYPQVLAAEPGDDIGNLLFGDQANLSALYGIRSIPQFVLIDKNGKIIAHWQHIGEEQTLQIRRLLQESDKASS